MNDLATYCNLFANLNVKITNGQRLPNKSILLISVMDLVRCGYIINNCIKIENTIKESFEYNWRIFVNDKPPSVWTPFWHMKKEIFWHFQPFHSMADVESLAKPGETASLCSMRKEIQYVYLDDSLFRLIQTKLGRETLFVVLQSNYLETKLL